MVQVVLTDRLRSRVALFHHALVCMGDWETYSLHLKVRGWVVVVGGGWLGAI